MSFDPLVDIPILLSTVTHKTIHSSKTSETSIWKGEPRRQQQFHSVSVLRYNQGLNFLLFNINPRTIWRTLYTAAKTFSDFINN